MTRDGIWLAGDVGGAPAALGASGTQVTLLGLDRSGQAGLR